MIYEYKFLIALCLTNIIEIPIIFSFVIYIFKYINSSKLNIIITSFFASTLTLPYLWFILPVFIWQRTHYILIGEISVFIVEAVFYLFLFKTKIHHAIILSFTANVASFLIGLFFF